jgi:hypothetical protein
MSREADGKGQTKSQILIRFTNVIKTLEASSALGLFEDGLGSAKLTA